jgi:hypothetical protein
LLPRETRPSFRTHRPPGTVHLNFKIQGTPSNQSHPATTEPKGTRRCPPCPGPDRLVSPDSRRTEWWPSKELTLRRPSSSSLALLEPLPSVWPPAPPGADPRHLQPFSTPSSHSVESPSTPSAQIQRKVPGILDTGARKESVFAAVLYAPGSVGHSRSLQDPSS